MKTIRIDYFKYKGGDGSSYSDWMAGRDSGNSFQAWLDPQDH